MCYRRLKCCLNIPLILYLSYEADLNEGNIWNVELKEKNAENARIVKCEISIYDAFQPDNFGGPVATGRQRCLQDLDELISTAARIKHRRSGTDLYIRFETLASEPTVAAIRWTVGIIIGIKYFGAHKQNAIFSWGAQLWLRWWYGSPVRVFWKTVLPKRRFELSL